jgi:uncharacterized membrane protein
MGLCKYKNILGKPNEGVHSYRIFNVAIVDTLLTVCIAIIIKLLIPKYNFFLILLILFITGIVMHRLFCVETTVGKLIFN